MLVRDFQHVRLGEASAAVPTASRADRAAYIKDAILIGVVVSLGTTFALRFIERLFGRKP